MSGRIPNTLVVLSLFLFGSIAVSADEGRQFPQKASFSTLITTPLVIEGLTGDNYGNLYAPGRTPGVGLPCPVWRVKHEPSPSLVLVGNIPAPSATTQCSPSGLTFDAAGKLYVTETDRIYSFFPDAVSPPLADLFASGVPGTNGVAFDREGNLWTGDGTTGVGRVWKINMAGVVTEMFRVQPMSNEVNLVGGVGGVGRDVHTLPPGTITVTPTSRNALNALGSQPLVANGVAFNREGDLLIADTARGAIWTVKFDPHGNLKSNVGCDTTFTANTLCLDNIFVAHPYLEGTDGIALDRAGNIWNSSNERNAIVVVTRKGGVMEVFRNPVNAAGLRNSADPAVGNDHILESPSSPFLLGKVFCTANSDGDRRDNSPRALGEINGGCTIPPAISCARGKISCMDQELSIPGLPLPVQ